MNKLKELNERYLTKIVWTLRFIIGVTFILSGIVKAIDLWGFTYKIEQYLNVWNISQPHSIVLFVATVISFAEFTLGALLFTGSYKRTSSWLLLLTMAFMLPLSLYIAIADPVSDCGCFGDFWIISNTATFFKNLIITVALVYLSIFNSRVLGLYSKYIQWIQVTSLLIYASVIGYEGYSVQPLLDFRPYKIGTPIIATSTDDSASDDISFIYEKDGEQSIFTIDNLPDSSWTFIERVELENRFDSHGFTIYDNDDDVTDLAISDTGEEILLIIPDISDVNIAYTYLINEIHRYITARNGSFVGLLATDSRGIELWKDLSLATYPLYSVEDTSLKEIARGQMSLLYLKDGIIQWKRTILSIDPALFVSPTDKEPLSELYISGWQRFSIISAILIVFMCILWALNRGGYVVKWYLYRKNKNKSVTLQKEKD